MRLSEDTIKGLITAIDFIPQDGKNGVYYKTYPDHQGYSVFVDFGSERIIYDSEDNPKGGIIRVWDKGSSNFSKAENFVVLECVDRLLKAGYAPACIELERGFDRKRSGRLDILVKTPEGTPFLLIECKTWGTEYEKERDRMVKNGGQLFFYYGNIRAAKYLCLYTSRVAGKAEYQNLIVDVDDVWRSLSEIKEIHCHWNKNFQDNGIFDSYASAYDIKHRAITYRKLYILKEGDSGKIYNHIMEILRHNAVSDKPNVFNKLLNLFMCKIVDENKNPDEEMEFQWREGDTDERLQLRLNDLYKEGMRRFLDIDIIDYTQEEVAQRLENLDPDTRQWVQEMYINTRLRKSPNFAFVEVQDARTFKHNARVVREIVELLQGYRFRYNQPHKFLGDFFELLLNTSIKQEAGQYFTPVPITRFILASLPLQKLVQDRVNARGPEPLPAVIDYACGSGHFLTEYMSRIQSLIDSGAIDLQAALPDVRNKFLVWQGIIKFQWAADTVYGIDLDNRLVKTSKVSAFFNGDANANVVWANGLDHFTKSTTYRGRLCHANGRENGQFDILISNPPYSVESFKGTVAYGEESFELFKYLKDSSPEIECLFVERMKQLVRVGGWAAVILPRSILTNGGIHARAREILLKYFYVKAVVELGAGTFMETGTNTVILFLVRRDNADYRAIVRAIETFFSTKSDVAAGRIEHAFSTYAACVYNGLPLADYLSIFSSTPTENARAHELYAGYRKAYGENYVDEAIRIEKEKMLYFILAYGQDVVLVKTGSGNNKNRFLGYKFSKRRGKEGLRWLPGGTKLYDESDWLNPQKASSYIYRAFLGTRIDVDPSLAQNVSYGRLSGFIEFGINRFDKVINLEKKIKVESRYPFVQLSDLVQIISGVTYDAKDQVYDETEQVVLTADNITGDCTLEIVKKIYLAQDLRLDVDKQLKKGDIFICLSSGSKEHVGKCAFVKEDTAYYAGGFMGILRRKGEHILPKYLWAALSSYTYRSILAQDSSGSNINNVGSRLGGIKIPLPPVDVQQKMVGELEQAESEMETLRGRISKIQSEISSIIEQCRQDVQESVKLRTIAVYSSERISAKLLNANTYVGVDNLLPNVAGKRTSEFVPVSGTVTAYHPGNILLSNIRPYLKKAWLADNHGGSSGDVLVLAVDLEKAVPEYVFALVSTDQFFDYEMQNIGSNVKMPRADKERVLDFQIPLPVVQVQQKIADEVARRKAEITQLNMKLSALKAGKDTILNKYIS